MLNAILDTRKANTAFHHFCALFMLRELTKSQLAATDATTEKVMKLFNLAFDYTPIKWNPWTLQSEPYEDNLNELSKVFYDEAAEATNRIAVDMTAVHTTSNFILPFFPKETEVTSRPNTLQDDFEDREIYPEVDLAVDVMDLKTKDTVHFTGRADWAFGYSGRQGAAHDTFFVAMEVTRRELFSSAESQLLTYLAILRELRIRAGKTNAVTQGFYTDGYQYRFMAIDADGEIEKSPIYDIMERRVGKIIFNFVVTMRYTHQGRRI